MKDKNLKHSRRTATISKFIKQNRKSYYSLEKISLLKVRYGGKKLKLERPKISSFHIDTNLAFLPFWFRKIFKSFQMPLKCGKKFKQVKMLLLSKTECHKIMLNPV